MKTLIKNGLIVNEGKSFIGSILIEDELISDIFSQNDTLPDSDLVIDATSKVVFPGIIDDQVHFREPGASHKATIESESKAAILGGVTSFMDMPNNNPPATTISDIEKKFDIAQRDSYANYSFYLGATNSNLDEILSVDPTKVCGVKLFMGSSTGNMLVDNEETLNSIFSKSKILLATHCEDEETIKENLQIAKDRYGEDIPFSEHSKIRSAQACIKSTQKALSFATKYNSTLHILHISTKEECKMLAEARQLNDSISGEICTHYLWFDERDYEKYGAKIKCNPAIKGEEDKYALRKALKSGDIQVVATDHAPHLLNEKSNNYLNSPSGIPMVQNSLQLMLELVKAGVFSLDEVATFMSHNPAKIFSIHRRGFIRKGYYADLAIVDLDKPSENLPAYKCGWSPFESFSTTVDTTIVNGEIVVKESKLTGVKSAKMLIFNR